MLGTKIVLNGIQYGLNKLAVSDAEYQALADNDKAGMMFESCTLEEIEIDVLLRQADSSRA